jgi:predicted small secreted protein
MKHTKVMWRSALIATLSLVLAGCNTSVNEDIEVAVGDRPAGSSMTVNGDVNVAPGARAADSSFRTVNGEIRLGDGAEVSDCATVNGTVDVGEGVRSGDLETVNGNLRLGRDDFGRYRVREDCESQFSGQQAEDERDQRESKAQATTLLPPA